jgi:lipoate-protein ligase A
MWRLLDTGARTAAENIALDDALLKARNKNLIPDTLRFLQFSPRCVLVGYHQSVEQEVREGFCIENEIEINRRITGGGAIFFDESQVGWEIIALKSSFPYPLGELYEKLCSGVVLGLEKLGLDAEFRPKNDIEINGRKISGTGGTESGEAFFFQGTLLVDFDVDTMLRALRIPVEKLKDREADSIKDRVTCLKRELGILPPIEEIKQKLTGGFVEAFDLKFENSGLTKAEENLLDINKFSSNEWIYGKRRYPKKDVLRAVHKAKGGLIRVSLSVGNNKIKEIFITGDFFAYPKRAVYDLEAEFKNAPENTENIKKIILNFFEKKKCEIPGVSPEDFVKVITEAVEKRDYLKFGITPDDANSIFTVNKKFDEAIKECGIMLMPYCAKLPKCKYRKTEECAICGECTVGEAYKIAKEHGIEAKSITSFENLMETLRDSEKRGIKGYIGCCCEPFYAKHKIDFESVNLSGILIDIDNTTCYDLGREEDAYLGKFENQTNLIINLLKKVVECMKT